MRRFGLPQADKLRACDNCKRSGTNALAYIGSKIRLPKHEDLAEIANGVGTACGEVGLFKCDHLAAFKQLPICPEHSDLLLVALRCPTDGQIYCFRPKALCFGSSSVLSQFYSFAILVSVLYWCVSSYVFNKFTFLQLLAAYIN